MRVAAVALKALALALAPRRMRFIRALKEPREAQRAVLGEILAQSARTEYGRHHGLTGSESLAEFRERIPVAGYDELRPWIERQKKEETRILCADPVRLYEKTSGSSGPAKYIPYTAALQKSFQEMFLLWAEDLITRGPGLRSGRLFFSVSPSFATETRTEAGVAVGLEDDTEYLHGWVRTVLRPFISLPDGLKKIRDPGVFKKTLIDHLRRDSRLEIISIWNPSFLEVLLDQAEKESGPLDWKSIWPELKLVSCWRAGNASGAAERLQRRLPHAFFQAKGLLATEAPLTLPWIEAGGFVPLIPEVFYEFEDARGRILGIDELTSGEDYGLIFSQKGGLLRYRIGDRVRAGSPFMGTPTLDFVGRDGAVSDLVGEKLNEVFVAEALARVLPKESSWVLLPVSGAGNSRARYVLALSLHGSSDKEIQKLGSLVDQALLASYHYRYARMLGQLDELEIHSCPDIVAAMQAHHVERGMKAGDIKSRALVTTADESKKILTRIGFTRT